jgi:photosystem II stability/assembly factor-like uncharacterized protein
VSNFTSTRRQLLCLALVSFILIPQQSKSQWVPGAGLDNFLIQSIAVFDSGVVVSAPDRGLYISTNGGASWMESDSGVVSKGAVQSIACFGNRIYAGANLFGGVSLSTNNGRTWASMDSGLTSVNVDAFAENGPNLFCGTAGGVFLSTNNGLHWSPAYSGQDNPDIRSLGVQGNHLFAGTGNPGNVYCSTDNGTTWVERDSGIAMPTVNYIWSFATVDTCLFAATDIGVFRSTNYGQSWGIVYSGESGSTLPPSISCIVTDGHNLFAGSMTFGVLLSRDLGESWTEVNSGLAYYTVQPVLTYTPIRSLCIVGTELWAGSWGKGIWRCSLVDLLTSVQNNETHNPVAPVLFQNFPNPFNPSTVITFIVPSRATVTLTVFDILGRQVATLVDGILNPGYKSVQWNVRQLPTGTYIYQLKVGNTIQAKTMLLLK